MECSAEVYYGHPVLTNKVLLSTPAMKKLKDEINRWLWTGTTGAVVLGESRVGKTTALEVLASQFYTRGGVNIPGYYTMTPQRDQYTIMSVFRQLCWQADIRFVKTDRADHLSDRFVHFMVDKAAEAKCEQAVLLVDEMQRLTPTQFNAYAEIYDRVRMLGVDLTVIFTGNDQESSDLLDDIEKPRNAHIRGRFFTQGYVFRGLTSKSDILACLKQYDKLCYPSDGPTYTAFFLPKEVRKGWQLASLSTDFWRIFHDYQVKYNIDSWGMKYFTPAVNTLLSDFLPKYGVDHFDDEMVHECIRISGLIPSRVKPVK